jgi:hypothetical protein
MDYNKMKNQTNEKFESQDFVVGDVFCEMLSYWEVIVDITDNVLTVINNLFDIKKYTYEEFTTHCKYNNIPGYWIDFIKNDSIYVERYIKGYIEKNNLNQSDIREFKLDLLM